MSVSEVETQIEQSPIVDPSSTEDWKNAKALEIKAQLEQMLLASGTLQITNKTKRLIKKLFNEQINLTDKMFQGFHSDGTPIGSLGPDAKEIDMLYRVLKKTPTLSFAKAERTIKKWMEQAIEREG